MNDEDSISDREGGGDHRRRDAELELDVRKAQRLPDDQRDRQKARDVADPVPHADAVVAGERLEASPSSPLTSNQSNNETMRNATAAPRTSLAPVVSSLNLSIFRRFLSLGWPNSLAFERRMWNRYESRGATPLPAGGSPRLTSRCAVGDGAPHVGAPSTEGLDHGSTLVGRKGGRGRRTSGEGAAAARSRPSRQGSHPTPRRPMRTGRTDEYGLDVAVPSRSRDVVASIPPCSGATNAGA